MTYGRMSNQYKKTSVETASKLDLVVLCYEKAIQFVMQTKEHYKNNEFEEKAVKLQKAIDFVNELKSSLNMDEGEQIAKNLDSIYTYIIKRLLSGDVKRDMAAFDEVIHIMSELKDAWVKISLGGEEQLHMEGNQGQDYAEKDFSQIAV